MKRKQRLIEFWVRYKKNKGAVLGMIFVGFFLLVAFFGPAFSHHDPSTLSKEALAQPNRVHPMGTDNIGRDVMSGVIYGARISLMVGLLAVLTSTVIGLTVGAISGFYGGRLDDFLMRVT